MENETANQPSTIQMTNRSRRDVQRIRDLGTQLLESNYTQDSVTFNSNIKRVIVLVIGLLVCPAVFALFVEGQVVAVKISENTGLPQAVVLKVHGKCEYSEDGLTFASLKPYRVLSQGAIV